MKRRKSRLKPIVNGKLQCSKCQEWLPANADHFSRNPQQSTGFSSDCKTCVREYRKTWWSNMRIIRRQAGTMLKQADGMTYEQIGAELGITKQRAEQIALRALVKLMQRAKKENWEPAYC